MSNSVLVYKDQEYELAEEPPDHIPMALVGLDVIWALDPNGKYRYFFKDEVEFKDEL